MSIHNLLSELYAQPMRQRGKKTYAIFPTAVSRAEGIFLASFVQKVKPKWIIEIGLGYAASTLWIESGRFHSAKHIVIDPYQKEFGNIGKTILKRLGSRNIEHVEQSSQEYLGAIMPGAKGNVDMVVVDSDVRFDAFITDMYFVSHLVRPGGFVVVRNIWNPAVRKGLMFYLKNLPYEIEVASKQEQRVIRYIPVIGELLLRWICKTRCVGWSVLQRIGADNRLWDHFVNF